MEIEFQNGSHNHPGINKTDKRVRWLGKFRRLQYLQGKKLFWS